jgi:NlpC/P60 family putative phage cell wall peptidase
MGEASISGPTVTRGAVVSSVRQWIGTPYQHQASLQGVGCDCLGLLRGLWRTLIGPEPQALEPYSPVWAEIATGDPLLEAACRHLVAVDDDEVRAGQVLVFRWRPGLPAKHCGIATGPTHFVHAHDGACVAEVALVPGWRRRITGRFEFPNQVD